MLWNNYEITLFTSLVLKKGGNDIPCKYFLGCLHIKLSEKIELVNTISLIYDKASEVIEAQVVNLDSSF